jgi:hypothetical protein
MHALRRVIMWLGNERSDATGVPGEGCAAPQDVLHVAA